MSVWFAPYDGGWKQHESGDWCVAFEDGTMAFPFNKVTKQIDGGPYDGIASFYRAIPAIMKHSSDAEAPTPKKPWWKVW